MAYTVTSLTDNDTALANIINFSREAFDTLPTHLYVNKVLYPALPANIPRNKIGLNQTLRTRLSLAINDNVNISIPEHIPALELKEISFTISSLKKNLINVHEEELKSKIRNYFAKYVFCEGQFLLMKYGTDTNIFVLHVSHTVGTDKSMTSVQGYIRQNTNIAIKSEDIQLNIIGAQFLKRDLFMSDYNFEEIGVGGLNSSLVKIFCEALSTRAFRPEIAKKLGISHVKGVLLYGPPGCGKTLIARKLGNLISPLPPTVINGPEILNKFVGQSEENLRTLFSKARTDHETNKENAQLHVIIFDEIDAICRARGRSSAVVNDSLVNQLLSMIDGVDALDNIFLIAMTNRKELLDEALLRAGRLEIHIFIGLADLNGRQQILRIHTNSIRNNNFLSNNVSIPILAEKTENFTGAELESVVKKAVAYALNEQLASNKPIIKDEDICVHMKHFLSAIDNITPLLGNTGSTLTSLMPKNFLLIPKHNILKETLLQHIREFKDIYQTILISGAIGSGKSTMAVDLALRLNVKHTKLVKPIDLLSLDEPNKLHYLTDLFASVEISSETLIVLDDIDNVINYTEFDGSVTFSHRLYQALIILLKTKPVKSKLILIMTCTSERLSHTLSSHFTITREMPLLSKSKYMSDSDLMEDLNEIKLPIRNILT